MNLRDYPRPINDTGIGFNFCSDTCEYQDEAIRFWIDELSQLGASWLVLPSTLDRPVPVTFLRELITHGIEPVIRVVVRPIRTVDPSAFGELCREYASAGVHYMHLYQEPNLATEWAIVEWNQPNLPKRFAELLLPVLGLIANAGLFPLLSPLAPGGHYWDLSFLEQLLNDVARGAPAAIIDRLGICIHNYASNLPLEWGQGGPTRWPGVRPYTTPVDSEDHRGFRLFEWYNAVVRRQLGDSLPLIAGETGLVPGTQNHASFPRVDETLHAERSATIAQMALDDKLPPYLFNVAFWTLNAGDGDPVDFHAWYRRDGSRLLAVEAIKGLPKHPRRPPESAVTVEADAPTMETSPVEVSGNAELAESATGGRLIDHYLLFQSFSNSPSNEWTPRQMMAGALEYVSVFQPTVGFRVDEARQARRVTMIGDDTIRLVELEEELRQAGCLVERIDVRNERDIREALGELVRRQKRFFHLPD